jgi:hypothetical protein
MTDLQSLTLKFQGGRVLSASSKNFLLYEQSCTDRPSNQALMQFGKVEKGRYILDFRHPLSPVQALSIALAAFGYKPLAKRVVN